MVFSKASEYALKSLVYMAKADSTGNFGVQEVADSIKVSKSYLAKVLQQLVKSGFLKSVTGPNGGFSFAREPAQIKVLEIVLSLDQEKSFELCFFGWDECSDNNPCPMHFKWKKYKVELRSDLGELNVQEAAEIAWPKLIKFNLEN